MSSFDIQSMDMSSLGGFSWNQASGMTNNHDMSGRISTGSTQMTGRSGKSRKSGKSALERKLEKVNEAHRRQQLQEMQLDNSNDKQQQQMPSQAQMLPQPHPHGGIAVATAGGVAHQQQQQRSPNNNNNTHHRPSRKFSQEHHNMSSLNSFGFEAIEEDELTEASYKMSNLGLSGMSEMDMTFGSSDVLSVRSKSAPKVRVSSGESERGDENGNGASGKKKGSGGGNGRRAGSGTEEHPGSQKRSNSEGDAEGTPPGVQKDGVGVTASSVFNHSLSSATSGTSGSSLLSNKSSSMKKSSHNLSMEDFNESFKSMEMEDRTRSSGDGSDPEHQQQRLPDPDGAVGGQRTYHASMAPPPPSSSRRRKDPSGGRLPAIHSSRASHHPTAAAAASNTHSNVRLSSSALANSRRESIESMGISDPDMLGNTLGNSNTDFGVSLESLRSFQSQGSDASSWLNQYNSMENVGSDKNPWDDEDQASGGTSTSEISAPRMVMATGGDA